MSSGTDDWLHRVYGAKGGADLVQLYDDWAASYDADMQGVGYVHPPVIAGLVARYVSDKAAPILDAGVGTGTVGNILAILGYRQLIGIDMSEGMLARAKARGIYAELRREVLGEPLGLRDGAVQAVVSTGVFTAGHAPPAAFDELVRVTARGGYLMFTVSTPVWEGQGFAGKLAELEAARHVTQVEVTAPYHPMPYSPAERALTTRAYVYRRL